MALVPCNVCGTLNSDEAEICLSCEYPIKGRRRPAMFQGVGVALLVLFTIPLFATLFSLLKPKPAPKPTIPPTTVSTARSPS